VACLAAGLPASVQAGFEQVLPQWLIKLYAAGVQGDQQLQVPGLGPVPAIEIAAAAAVLDLSGPAAAAEAFRPDLAYQLDLPQRRHLLDRATGALEAAAGRSPSPAAHAAAVYRAPAAPAADSGGTHRTAALEAPPAQLSFARVAPPPGLMR
jgi:hypothetical protein